VKYYILIAFYTLSILFSEADQFNYSAYSNVNRVWSQSVGKAFVQYGVDAKSNRIIYCVISPIEGIYGLNITMGPNKISSGVIRYHGIEMDGPCSCMPLVVVGNKRVARFKIRAMTTDELNKILDDSTSIEDLQKKMTKIQDE
jgi:hypothetical protein